MSFEAQYQGWCHECDEMIHVGQSVAYKNLQLAHDDCPIPMSEFHPWAARDHLRSVLHNPRWRVLLMTGAQPIHNLQGAMADRLWMVDAACRDFDPDLWFPDPADRDATAEAKRICRFCPVKDRCEDYADEIGALYGIFAGQRRTSMVLPPRKRGSCGTPSGYGQHRLAHEKACTPCQEAQRNQSRERRADGRHK